MPGLFCLSVYRRPELRAEGAAIASRGAFINRKRARRSIIDVRPLVMKRVDRNITDPLWNVVFGISWSLRWLQS
jgi:hypothetical protein